MSLGGLLGIGDVVRAGEPGVRVGRHVAVDVLAPGVGGLDVFLDRRER